MNSMKPICVITGAAGGIGLAVAKKMGETHSLVISDIKQETLDSAIRELKGLGIEVDGMVVNVAERAQVKALAEKANAQGRISAVIHLAGLTPTFAAPADIMRVNTMGPIYVNEEFYKVMGDNSCILDICSSTAYMLPPDRIPSDVFELVRGDEDSKDAFYQKMMDIVMQADEGVRQGMAYTYSRAFVHWYVRDCCFAFGKKGIRVVSVAPGIVDTEMSRADMKKSGNLDVTLSYCALGRLGRVEEVAFLMSTLVDERNSYVTGVDVLCDGGCYAAGYKGQRTPKE